MTTRADKDRSQSEAPSTSEIIIRRGWKKEIYLGLLGFLAMLLLAGVVVYFWEEVQDLGSYGYLGAFFVCILGGATIIVPIPHVPVIFALGGVMPIPALVGLAAGLGEPIGELTGYLAGFGGRGVLQGKNRELQNRLVGWVEGRGPVLTVFLSAMFPNPLFDLVGAAAGALRLSLWKFLLACWAGKTIKGLAIAYAGAWGLGSVLRWLSGF